MNTTRYLTTALAKGRLANRAMGILEVINISCDEMKGKVSRKLTFVNEDPGVHFFLAKANDIPIYVEYRVVDTGMVGGGTILEEGRKLYEVTNLGMGKCRVCVCGPESARERLKHHGLIRVATKYPNIAKDYFYNQKYQTVEIIKLNGSTKLTLIVGLSEVIVNIVEIGSTLWENGLMMPEEVYDLPVRMVVNQVSMKTENERIAAIAKKFQSYLRKNAGKWDDRSKSGRRRNVRYENRDIRQ